MKFGMKPSVPNIMAILGTDTAGTIPTLLLNFILIFSQILPVDEVGADGEEPFLEDVLHESRLAEPPLPSRLPPQHG